MKQTAGIGDQTLRFFHLAKYRKWRSTPVLSKPQVDHRNRVGATALLPFFSNCRPAPVSPRSRRWLASPRPPIWLLAQSGVLGHFDYFARVNPALAGPGTANLRFFSNCHPAPVCSQSRRWLPSPRPPIWLLAQSGVLGHGTS